MALATGALAQGPVPRIVNGTPTAAHPSVGALLFYADPLRTKFDGLCSGTLVGCRTFVTAAHCVCTDVAEDAAACARLGLVDAATMQVYLEHAGFFDVDSVVIHPEYAFAEAGDIAVLKLGRAPTGVAPSPINTSQRPLPGTRGTLVGFGRTGGRERDEDDSGLKREGPVTTAPCDSEVPDATHICWRFLGEGSSTCSGDSGGPLFVGGLGGAVLAGVTSGGNRSSCLAPDFSFDTDVFVYRSFVADQAAEDLGGAACDDRPAVGTSGVVVLQRTGTVSASAREGRFEIQVPAGTSELRVGMNGQAHGGTGSSRDTNQFNLYLRAGTPPTRTDFECGDRGGGVFGFCAIAAPRPGTWHVLVDNVQGAGGWQVTATLFPDSFPPDCVGDCDGDFQVTVDELVTGISLALGNGSREVCLSLDADTNSVVTVDEIVAAVSNALEGCVF